MVDSFAVVKAKKKMKKNRRNVCRFLENAYLCNRKRKTTRK